MRKNKRYTIALCTLESPIGSIENTLNNYASIGWALKSTFTYPNGVIAMIFER